MSVSSICRSFEKYENEDGWVVSFSDSSDESMNFSYAGLSKNAADLIFSVEMANVNKKLATLDPDTAAVINTGLDSLDWSLK
jgi:hypothetical protein